LSRLRGKERNVSWNTGVVLSTYETGSGRDVYKARDVAMMVFIHLCVISGLFYTLTSIFSLHYRLPDVMIGTAAVCATIWWRYLSGAKATAKIRKVWLLAGIFLVPYGIYLWFRYRQGLTAFQFGAAEMQEVDTTLILLLLSALLSFVSFYLVFVMKKGWLFYLITIPSVLAGPYLGNEVNFMVIFLFASFHIGNSVLANACSYGGVRGESRISGAQAKIIASSTALVTLTALFLFLAVSAVSVGHMERLLNLSEGMEQQAARVMDGLFHGGAGAGAGGRINPGNMYPTGEEQLEVTISEKPEEDVYLKNFTGGDYLGNEWAQADESSFYGSVMNSEGGGDRGRSWARYFEERQFYYVLYSQYLKDTEGQEDAGSSAGRTERTDDLWAESGAAELSIRFIGRGHAGPYTPYIAGYKDMEEGAYTFMFYTRSELADAMGEIRANGEREPDESGRWWMEQRYREYARETYLAVPADHVPRLAALVRETPLPGADAESITAHIQETLHREAYYTLRPGMTPFWEDSVDYFLFKNKKGYCQHFASAAVLMYRLYGVPARYAGGYRATASSFTVRADGTYGSVLTDENAHAWVEIYDDTVGWIPVDVTPGGGSEELLPDDAEEEDAAGAAGASSGENSRRFYRSAVLAGIVLAVLWIAALLRRRWILGRSRDYTADHIFERLMGVLHLGGRMKGFSGGEDDFALALTRAAPCVAGEEADRLVKVVYRDVFGRERASREETKAVCGTYDKVCDAVYGALTPYEKFRFRYVWAYR
jgi:transglutaminase-like putative cysteine protease